MDRIYSLVGDSDLGRIRRALESRQIPLIIVDMQEGYLRKNFILEEVSRDVLATIKKIILEISLSRRRMTPIVIATYDGFGPVIPEIEDAVYGYDKLTRIAKATDNLMVGENARVVLKKLPPAEFPLVRIAGLQEPACVLQSIEGLLNNGYAVVLNDGEATDADLGLNSYAEKHFGMENDANAISLFRQLRQNLDPRIKSGSKVSYLEIKKD